MQALESLIEEHRLISRLISALAVYAQRLEQGDAVEPGDLARFSGVFTQFAECIHHEKEENILLPLLSRNGFDWQTAPLSTVRSDHQQENYLIDVLHQAAEQTEAWDSEARRRIAATARVLVDFQRDHHRLENEELFPRVTSELSSEAILLLGAALDKFDREHLRLRTDALAVANRLIDRYAPEPEISDCEEDEACLGPDEA